MTVFAINSGSSSLKVKVFAHSANAQTELIFSAEAKKRDGEFSLEILSDPQNSKTHFDTWEDRLQLILKQAQDRDLSIERADFVLHRVVHGWDNWNPIVRMDKQILHNLKSIAVDVAPLHNPQALEIIDEIYAKTHKLENQYACFDTAFGADIPVENYIYSLPADLRDKYGIRKFLFHGLSHKYVMNLYYDTYTTQKTKKIVSLHLGSGSSVCAINCIHPVDSSFGFSPLENLITSTRIGEFDIDAYNFLKKKAKLSDIELSEILNKKSGLLGLSGYSSDMKRLIDDYSHNPAAKLAVDTYVSFVVKYVFQSVASLGGIDVLIFTGGIGQVAPFIRTKVCAALSIFGVNLDSKLNENTPQNQDIFSISENISKVEICVANTDEERQMLNELVLSEYFR